MAKHFLCRATDTQGWLGSLGLRRVVKANRPQMHRYFLYETELIHAILLVHEAPVGFSF